MTVLRIVRHLAFAAARGFCHGARHRAGDGVGIEHDASFTVPGSSPDRLDQRRLGAQEAFLVGVEDADEGALGNVEPLAQQVDANQAIELAEAQVADDLDTLDRVDVGVHVAHAHALLVHVLGQLLGHLLGERGDERAVALLRRLLHLVDAVVDLVGVVLVDGADLDRRVDQVGRADDLFGEDATGLVELPRARRCRDVYGLRAHLLPLVEFERAVVEAAGQTEAVFGQGELAVEVAPEHRADLRDGLVAFVDEDHRVFGQIFEQGRRRLARRTAREIAAVVLDAGT